MRLGEGTQSAEPKPSGEDRPQAWYLGDVAGSGSVAGYAEKRKVEVHDFCGGVTQRG